MNAVDAYVIGGSVVGVIGVLSILTWDAIRNTKDHIKFMRRQNYLENYGTQPMFDFSGSGDIIYRTP